MKIKHEKQRLAAKVEWFAKCMTDELHRPKNLKKGGWRHDHWSDLLRRLDEELLELKQAISDGGSFADARQVCKEAVDVANFAMMIADNFCNDEEESPP